MAGGAVVQRLHRHRVAQDARRFQHVADPQPSHRLAGLMHLDPARPAQPHHPDEPGAGRQQFGDLGAQLGLVLPAAGVFHRQRRRAGNPAAGFMVGRGRGHGDVGRVQGGGVGAEPGVHAGPGDVRVAVDDGGPGQMGRGVIAPGGGAVERMAVGEFVTVALAELVGAERAGFWLAVAMRHGESPGRGRRCGRCLQCARRLARGQAGEHSPAGPTPR